MDYLGGLSEMNGLGSRYESDLGNISNGIQNAKTNYAFQLKGVQAQAQQATNALKSWGTDTGIELGGTLAYKGLYSGSALQSSINDFASSVKGTIQDGIENAYNTTTDVLGDAVSKFYGMKPSPSVSTSAPMEEGSELDTFQTYGNPPKSDPAQMEVPELETASSQPTGTDYTPKDPNADPQTSGANDTETRFGGEGEDGVATEDMAETGAEDVGKSIGESFAEDEATEAIASAPLDETGIGEAIMIGSTVYEGVKALFDFFDRPTKPNLPNVANMIAPTASTFISTAVQSGA
jgi:hypothetical protein